MLCSFSAHSAPQGSAAITLVSYLLPPGFRPLTLIISEQHTPRDIPLYVPGNLIHYQGNIHIQGMKTNEYTCNETEEENICSIYLDTPKCELTSFQLSQSSPVILYMLT